jgi:hypothetical protein
MDGQLSKTKREQLKGRNYLFWITVSFYGPYLHCFWAHSEAKYGCSSYSPHGGQEVGKEESGGQV